MFYFLVNMCKLFKIINMVEFLWVIMLNGRLINLKILNESNVSIISNENIIF